MKTVELTQDECDLIVSLVKQQNIPVVAPEALRVLTALQEILKKLTSN